MFYHGDPRKIVWLHSLIPLRDFFSPNFSGVRTRNETTPVYKIMVDCMQVANVI